MLRFMLAIAFAIDVPSCLPARCCLLCRVLSKIIEERGNPGVVRGGRRRF